MNPASCIYELYEATNEKREHSMSHYPSSLCAIKGGQFIGKCRRATGYSLLGEEKSDPIPGVNLFKMDIGNVLHDMLNKKLDESLAYDGLIVPTVEEVRVKWKEAGLDLPMSGRIDKVFIMPDETLGAEWKTTFGRGVTDVKNNGPKEDALLQVLAYFRQKVYPIDRYLLSYLAKDSGYIFSFMFYKEKSQVWMEWLNTGAKTKMEWNWKNIKDALMPLETATASGELLDGDYWPATKGKNPPAISNAVWRCKYCDYAKTCYQDAARKHAEKTDAEG